MIVLPNTPPAPKPITDSLSLLPPHILAVRATIDSTPPSTHAESVRYVMKLQEYLDSIFDVLVSREGTKDLAVLARLAEQTELGSSIPWTNVQLPKKRSQWTLASEILISSAAASFMYTRLGAELTNELIDTDQAQVNSNTSRDTDLKWKAVSAYYKSAIGLCLFGAQFRCVCTVQPQLSLSVFVVLDQVCNIGIQMLLLCKSLWANRMAFTDHDSFDSSNNGVLCRVAIWVLDEINNCQNVVRSLDAVPRDTSSFHLCTLNWLSYLRLLEKYASAYAALFLSIEYYQKDKVGLALGLVNFALLTIQSKNVSTLKPLKRHLVSRFKNKLAEKKNDRYISSLQSTTSLKIDKSVFSSSSGVVLNDLSYLFDQLVLFHLKLEKENDNIKFDTVVDWQDVHADSKWPLGCKMPVSAVSDFIPRALVELHGLDSSTQRQYF